MFSLQSMSIKAALAATFLAIASVCSAQINPNQINWPTGSTGCVYAPGTNTCVTVSAGLPVCADTSGSGTAQSCTTSPSFTPAANSCVIYTTTTANTGTGLTVNVNSLGAKTVEKWQSLSTLAIGDVAANRPVLACYDGTNWNLATIGNAPSGGGMVWPGGGAGIPNYSGSSAWGTSYSASNLIPANFLPEATNSTFGTVEPDNTTISISGGVISAVGGAASTPTPFSYTLYVSAGTTYAVNNQTGTTPYSDTDAAVVINDVLGATSTTGATLYFKPGTYNFNSATAETVSPYTSYYYCVGIPSTNSGTNYPTLRFLGGSSQTGSQNLPATSGVIFNVTSAAITAAGSNLLDAFWMRPSTAHNSYFPFSGTLFWNDQVEFDNIVVQFPANTRAHEHAFDMLEASFLKLNHVTTGFITAPTALGAADTIAVVTPGNPADGAILNEVYVEPGFDTAYQINSEHTYGTYLMAFRSTTAVAYGAAQSRNGQNILNNSAITGLHCYDDVNCVTVGSHVYSTGVQLDLFGLLFERTASTVWAFSQGIYTNANLLGGTLTWGSSLDGNTDASFVNPFTSGSGTAYVTSHYGVGSDAFHVFQPQTSDPGSPTTGYMWWNSTSSHLNFYNGSTTTNLLGFFTNPMTTLGDTLYGGSSGAGTRLAGPATSGHTFFLQAQPSGSAVAPSWGDFASPPALGAIAPNTGTFSSVKDTSINGVTQCVQADSSGNFSGTGSACGTGGGGTTVISAPPYITLGSNSYLAGDGMFQVTKPPASGSVVWVNSAAPSNVASGTNGNLILTTAHTNAEYWQELAGSTSAECVMRGFNNSVPTFGNNSMGCWMWDSTNSKIYQLVLFFGLNNSAAGTTTMCAQSYTYNGSGNPSSGANLQCMAGVFGLSWVHMKLIKSGTTLLFQVSLDGGSTYQTAYTQTGVGTLADGGVTLNDNGTGATNNEVVNVASLQVQ